MGGKKKKIKFQKARFSRRTHNAPIVKDPMANPMNSYHADIQMKDSDRETYHCAGTRKMHISKLDPTIAFAFYLRNAYDFKQFYWMMKDGKKRFQGDWPFSLIDIDWVNQYYDSIKKSQMGAESFQAEGKPR